MIALTAQGFLSKRLKLCTKNLSSLTERKNTILSILDHTTSREMHAKLIHLLREHYFTVQELKVLQTYTTTIDEDLTDEIVADADADAGESFEMIYTSRILPRYVAPDDRDLVRFKEGIFQHRVLRFYSASRAIDCRSRYRETFCNLVGWSSEHLVKTMRVVPGSMGCSELWTAFGVEKVDLYSPRNGICISTKVARALRKGSVVLLPVDEKMKSWKLVIVDKECERDICVSVPGISGGPNRVLLMSDFLDRELIYHTRARPATRFLLFRFITTYLIARGKKNTSFTEMIDTEYAFIWNEMGQYLRRSAVASLAWNFGGFIIPGVSGSSTPLESVPGENNDRDGAVLAALLNKTVVESEWARVEEDQNEYGDENGDEPQVEEVENTPGLYWRGMAR